MNYFSNQNQQGNTDNLKALDGIKILSQNINSFNLSTISESNLNRKINSITKGKPDIILISDVRAGPKTNKLEKKLLYNETPYLLHLNSTSNKRGVGILIKKGLNCEIISTFKDDKENLLGIKAKINQLTTLIVSCYGENNDNAINFYNTLQGFIDRAGTEHIIIGGDMNTVCDPTKINGNFDQMNLDILNMRANINPNNSVSLNNLLRRNNLFDPFRIKNPLKREFSYIPFAQNNKNRSRIDYIFVSNSLLIKSKVEYEFKTSKQFDHKPVLLTIGCNSKNPNKTIDSTLLNNKLVKDNATITAFNTYLEHLPENQPWENILLSLNNISARNQLITSSLFNSGNLTDFEIDTLNTELVQNNELFDSEISRLPSIDELDTTSLKIDKDLFLTTLLNNITNSTISVQSEIRKVHITNKTKLITELNILKKDFNKNIDKILETEKKINDIIDDELTERHKDDDKFFNLRFEKNSGHFNKIFRASKSGDNISKIKCKNGATFSEFDNKTARDSYIKNYYGKIYQIQDLPDMSIEDFLGEDILGKQEVQAKRLSDIDRENLDRQISLEELETSLKSSNFNSAPGIDGLSNKVLRAFWSILKNAIFEGFNSMIDKGYLTPLLKVGGIRLIPKKGELSDIANWRPISLLSVVYKLFSGVVTKRLEPHMDVISSKSQKGYSRSKRIHDAVINITELINICSSENIDLITIAIDFSKAFDSVHSPYIFKVLEFFNFGPYFKKLIEVCLTGRLGCIITETGYTPNFEINQGVPQGDRLSPYLFILCLEILLIKISFSNELSGPDIPGLPKHDKLEGFADDLTASLAAKSQNIIILNQILTNFRLLSGLKVNNDKTKIILTSTNQQLINEITGVAEELGFLIVEEMELLGFTIYRDPSKLKNNWNKVVQKITKKCHTWKIFNLSMQGRIIVAKTHLTSQLQYVGTILPSSLEVEQILSSIIENFVQGGNKKISKEKLYSPVTEGGINLIKIKPFLLALKAGLIKHAQSFCDWWATVLIQKTMGNNLNNIDNIDVSKVISTPIIFNIALAWRAVCDKFFFRYGNIKKAKIINNNLIKYNGSIIKELGSRNTWNLHKDRLENTVLKDLLQPGTNIAARRDILNQNLGVDLNLLEYMRMRQITDQLLTKFSNNLTHKCEDFYTFMFRPEKGSRKLRELLQDDHLEIRNHNLVVYYRNLLRVDDIDKLVKPILPLWKLSYISYDFSNFIFNYTQNNIITRDRLSHFKNVQDTCPLCLTTGSIPLCRDSIKHAFSDCQSVNNLWTNYFIKINLNTANICVTSTKLIGFLASNQAYTVIINIDLFLVRYFIHKLRSLEIKKVLQGSLTQFLNTNRSVFAKSSTKYREAAINLETHTGIKLCTQ